MIENLGYLISSHRDYTQPLTRLLMSMYLIRRPAIAVVCGGYDTPSHTTVSDGSLVCRVTHNSYDYNGIIDLVEHPDQYPAWSHVFLLHDTMQLGPNSHPLICAADPALDCVAAWGGECNLALYRVDYLMRRRADILALKNCTKLQAVESEGFLWRTCPTERRGSYAGNIQIGDERPIYGGAARLSVVYTGVDVTKYKANWGQLWPPSVVTP